MHAACSHLPHSVLHSPTIQFSYSTAKKGAAVKLSSCSAFVSELETGCKSLSPTDNQWEMTSLRVYMYACRVVSRDLTEGRKLGDTCVGWGGT